MGNALIQNGAVVLKACTIHTLNSRLKQAGFPPKPPKAPMPYRAGGFEYVEKVPTAEPVADHTEEIDPVLIDGAWVMQWVGRDFTVGEVAANLSRGLASALEDITNIYQAKVRSLTEKYEQEEINSFPDQVADAREYKANLSALNHADYLEAVAALPPNTTIEEYLGLDELEYLVGLEEKRGGGLDSVANRVLVKRKSLRESHSRCTGRKQWVCDQLNAAPDIATIDNIRANEFGDILAP